MSDKVTSKKARHRLRNRILFILEILILFVLAAGVYIYAQFNGVVRNMGSELAGETDPLNVDDVFINESLTSDERLSGYTNIALVGIDTRDVTSVDYANSDTMIVASINNDTQEVRMVSIYRDTYLNVNPMDPTYDKANSAYCRGSAAQMLSMINANLDLDITEYVVIDFRALARLVDALGGVTVYMTQQEAHMVNDYCVETSEVTGMDYTPLDVPLPEVEIIEPKDYDLNGVQAVAYCRIRKTDGLDFKRTQRQRLIIKKVIEKAKKKGLRAVQAIISDVLPLCKTSLSSSQILKMASQMFNYELTETSGFPICHIEDWVGDLDCVIPVTLEANVIELHKFLFDDENYEVTEAVRTYSSHIIDRTGYDESWIERASKASVIAHDGGESDTIN